mmetsp:Transcript_10275/g.62965  ORF Transcript_10275/g.62965 Transcript_10275/m.62965 type:complete len:554 (-) Transcript_10275:3934-5595(-)
MKRTSNGTNRTKRKEEKQTTLKDAFRNTTEVRSPRKNEGNDAWDEDPTDEGPRNANQLFDPYWTETFNIVLGEQEREKRWRREDGRFDDAMDEKTTRGKRTRNRGVIAYDDERKDGGPTNPDKNQDQTKYVTMVRKLVDAGKIPPAAEYDRMLELLAQCRGEEDVHLAAELYVLLASMQRSSPPIRRSKHASGITVNTLAWAPVDGIARGKMCGCEEEHMKKQGIVEEWERMSRLLRDVAQLLENQQRRLDGKILVFKHYVSVLAHDLDVRVTTQSLKQDKSYKPYQESMLWRLLSNAKPVGKGSIRESIECLVKIMVGGTESKLGTTSQEPERSGGLDDPSLAMVSLTDPRALGRQAGVLLAAILHILSQAEHWEKKKGIRILRYQRLEADGTLLELFRTKLDSFESKSQFLTYLCGQGQKRRFIGSLFAFGANKKVADKVAPTLTVASAASTYEHIPVETQHIFSYTAADVGRAVKFTGGVDLLMLLLSHLIQADVEEEGPREEVNGAFQAAREAVEAYSGSHSTTRNVLTSQGQVFCLIAGHCASIACSS